MATVYDIITEAYAYPYSKECFEMTKLEYELALREKYMENVAFYRNDDFNSLVRESDYLSESAYFDTTDSLFFEDGSGATSARAGGLLSRVWDGIKKIFNQFIGFFKKLFLGKKLVLDVNDRQAIKGAISEHTFTSKDVDEIAKQTGKSVDQWADLDIQGANPGDIKTDNTVNVTKKKALKNIFTFYLGEKEIKIANPIALIQQSGSGGSSDKDARVKRLALASGGAILSVGALCGVIHHITRTSARNRYFGLRDEIQSQTGYKANGKEVPKNTSRKAYKAAEKNLIGGTVTYLRSALNYNDDEIRELMTEVGLSKKQMEEVEINLSPESVQKQMKDLEEAKKEFDATVDAAKEKGTEVNSEQVRKVNMLVGFVNASFANTMNFLGKVKSLKDKGANLVQKVRSGIHLPKIGKKKAGSAASEEGESTASEEPAAAEAQSEPATESYHYNDYDF